MKCPPWVSPQGIPWEFRRGGISQESPQDLAPLLGLVGSAWAQVHSLQRQWLDSPMAKTSNCETFWGAWGYSQGYPQVYLRGVPSGTPLGSGCVPCEWVSLISTQIH